MKTRKDEDGDKVMVVDPQSNVPEEKPSTAQEGSNHENGTQQAFLPGSIHKKEVQNFWRKELKASEWVMTVLEEGYVIPFTKPPPAY